MIVTMSAVCSNTLRYKSVSLENWSGLWVRGAESLIRVSHAQYPQIIAQESNVCSRQTRQQIMFPALRPRQARSFQLSHDLLMTFAVDSISTIEIDGPKHRQHGQHTLEDTQLEQDELQQTGEDT